MDPLVPPEVDLRGLPWMPLDIIRLKDSDTHALCRADKKNGGWAFMASVMLWGASWYQTPAGSLTDNETILAELSGAGERWPSIRDIVMRGWVKCSDGRLYHKVVAEAALRAWEERLKHMTKREKDKARLDQWRAEQREKGNLDKTGKKRGPRRTETPEEIELKRVSDELRNAERNGDETDLSRREEKGQGRDREEKPVGGEARAPNPDVITEFPSDWKPCATSLAMLKQHAMPDPKPEHVAAFVGHWLGKSIEPRRIPGEFLKWMARQKAIDARDGTGSSDIDTTPAWMSFRAAIRDQRPPEDGRVAAVLTKLGGLHRLGERSSYDLDQMRKTFDREFKASTQ